MMESVFYKKNLISIEEIGAIELLLLTNFLHQSTGLRCLSAEKSAGQVSGRGSVGVARSQGGEREKFRNSIASRLDSR